MTVTVSLIGGIC